MGKYEIQIGEVYDIRTDSYKPKMTFTISHEQREIIELLADHKKDAALNTIYKINECEFRIVPKLDLQPKE